MYHFIFHKHTRWGPTTDIKLIINSVFVIHDIASCLLFLNILRSSNLAIIIASNLAIIIASNLAIIVAY